VEHDPVRDAGAVAAFGVVVDVFGEERFEAFPDGIDDFAVERAHNWVSSGWLGWSTRDLITGNSPTGGPPAILGEGHHIGACLPINPRGLLAPATA